MGGAGEFAVEIEQMSSKYFLNSCRCEVRNEFIGSIHASFVPKDDMFARPCSDFAIRVNVLRAFAFG